MRNSVIIAAMAATVTAFALPAAASPVSGRTPTEVKIQISQADLRGQSAESVYLHLRRTAREACDSASSELRMQREDRPANPVDWAGLDAAHGAIAVFHRKGEIAFLQGTAHPGIFAFGHTSCRNEAFGAAADSRPKR